MKSYAASPEEILGTHRVVAVVGASKNPEKDAYTVPLYLIDRGFTVIPVNPGAESIHGVRAYPSLDAIPADVASTIEVVDVFRPSQELPEIARQVTELKKRTGRAPVFWAQLGLRSEAAETILARSGIPYVMDACIRTEHQLLRRERQGS